MKAPIDLEKKMTKPVKCDVCGKFTTKGQFHIQEDDSSDGFPGKEYIECIRCISPFEAERLALAMYEEEDKNETKD